MSNNVIHFKTAKKKAGYAQKETQATENRKKFGRTKAEKNLDTLETKKTKQTHDDHKLDT